MRRALGIDEASYGPDHPNVATDLNNLAQLLQATNRLGEAEPLMRRALGIDEASYGPDHPNVAIRPQQPRAVAASHQPARRGGTADAPRAGDLLRVGSGDRARASVRVTVQGNYAGLPRNHRQGRDWRSRRRLPRCDGRPAWIATNEAARRRWFSQPIGPAACWPGRRGACAALRHRRSDGSGGILRLSSRCSGTRVAATRASRGGNPHLRGGADRPG